MNKIKIYDQIIDGCYTSNVPKKNKTIADDFEISYAKKKFQKYEVIKLDEKGCWVIFFFRKNTDDFPVFFIEIPSEMTEKHLQKWLKPLREALLL